MTKQDASKVVEQDISSAAGTAADETSEGSADVSEDHPDAASGKTADGVSEVESTPASPASTSSTPRSALEREGEVAADFLEQLLDIADLDGDIDVDVDGDRAAVAIVDSEEGRVSRRLVGANGKVLDALQELTRLAVQAATGERSRLMLDVAGYRAERRAAVVTVAQAAIAVVRSTNEKVALEPMTAFERKVVHTEVLAAGLGSESDGVEPQRYVVILPA
jgi:spoIIIJ-associated protein